MRKLQSSNIFYIKQLYQKLNSKEKIQFHTLSILFTLLLSVFLTTINPLITYDVLQNYSNKNNESFGETNLLNSGYSQFTLQQNTFSNYSTIVTPWLTDNCSKYAFLVQICIVNLSSITMNNSIKAYSIYWEIVDYDGNYLTKSNVTRVNFSRNENDNTILKYKIAVFVNESYSLCSFNINKYYTIHFGINNNIEDSLPLSPFDPDFIDNPSIRISNIANYLELIFAPTNIYESIQMVKKLVSYIKKKKFSQKKLVEKTSEFDKYGPYI